MTEVTAPTIQEEIGGLADLDLVLLRRRWLGLYGSEAPARISRELLVQAIAYRLQENAFGGLSSVTLAKMTSRRGPKGIERTRINRSVKLGTRFIREWQGRTVEVIADGSGGYLYRGCTYTSLSAIAREITGTRWSGPAFFGLTAVETAPEAALRRLYAQVERRGARAELQLAPRPAGRLRSLHRQPDP